MNIEALQVKAFTCHGQGGNPAGVVLNADALNDAQKLQIAQSLAYPETAFVAQDSEHDVDFSLSFFTPTEQVDFCGHATLAAFASLHQQGIISDGNYVQRTKAGRLGIGIAHGVVTMEQRLPVKIASVSYHDVAPILGLDSRLLASTQLPIEIISTGLADVMIAIPHGYLDQIQVNEQAIADFCKSHDAIGFHLFELAESGHTASCRNFAPLVGIREESATGSACGALACYLAEHLGTGQGDYHFEQGRAMNCRSLIHARVEYAGKDIVRISVSGDTHTIGRVTVQL